MTMTSTVATAWVLGLLLLVAPVESAFALEPVPAKTATLGSSASIRIVGAEPDSAVVSSIQAMLTGLMEASNNHDLEGVLNFYSSHFVSGDNLSLDAIRKLIEETWELYPDISYESETLEIRVNGNWATVESRDFAEATATSSEKLGEKPGVLKSSSRGLLFLKRVGRTWEVVSDYTLYEEAQIFYGHIGKDIKVHLSTPDQVFAGESYTAELSSQLPSNSFAIVTISKDPIVYPQPVPEEKFRTLTQDKKVLERVFEPNETNNNEIVTAIIGITEIGHDEKHERPVVQLSGLATLVKRVNVIPKSTYTDAASAQGLVRTSASGKVDLTEEETTAEDSVDESPESMESEPSEEDSSESSE